MKKYLMLAMVVVMAASCVNDELEQITDKMMAAEKSRAAAEAEEKGDKKEDPNFRIFKDRTKGSKEY